MGFAGNGTSDSELAEVRAMANRQFLEIQALKQIIDANNLSQNIGQFVNPVNEPVAYRYEDKSNPLVFYFTTRKDEINNPDAIEIPLYSQPVKEQSTNERIEMLKEMIEKIANPVGWIGYQEGHLVSFLKTQEQVNSFLTATDPTGRVEPVYTHPVKELALTDEEMISIYEKDWSGIKCGLGRAVEQAILRKAQEK
jgi:hypothetical protein